MNLFTALDKKEKRLAGVRREGRLRALGTIAGQLFGADFAKSIQLSMEYNPAPPFSCGHPSIADRAVVDDLKRKRAPSQQARLETASRAAKMYCG